MQHLYFFSWYSPTLIDILTLKCSWISNSFIHPWIHSFTSCSRAFVQPWRYYRRNSAESGSRLQGMRRWDTMGCPLCAMHTAGGVWERRVYASQRLLSGQQEDKKIQHGKHLAHQGRDSYKDSSWRGGAVAEAASSEGAGSECHREAANSSLEPGAQQNSRGDPEFCLSVRKMPWW